MLRLHDPHDTCPACGGRRGLSFGERPGIAPRWYLSTACATCGSNSEADGDGELPDDLRAMEVARNGLWALVVATGPTTLGWRALRAALGLDAAAVAAMRRRIPGVVFQGTIVQAARVREAFVRGGAAAELEAVGSVDV